MVQIETMREKVFNMRMSAEEWARIEAVSSHYALNAAALIRYLVKREADALSLITAKPGTFAESMARRHALEDPHPAARLGAAFAERATKKAPTKPAKKGSKR